jgi:ATP-binding cassette subfamily F protein 3
MTDVCKSFGAQPVLRDINLTIGPGEKVGLVGPNGSGKTTLLRMILREVEPDQGDVVIAGEPEIGYVRQDVLEGENVTVEQAVLGQMEELEQRLAALRREIASSPNDEGPLAKYEVLEEELSTRFGTDYRSRVEKALDQFGFGPDRHRSRVNSLSPGERARLELGKVLVANPEFLVLDEPTNFLDIGQREWLERFVEEFSGTVLVVSHDRVLLNRVVNRIFELRRTRLKAYEGNYDDYEFVREQERARLAHDHDVQQKEIHKLERVALEHRVWSGRKEKEKKGAGDKGFIGARAARLAKRAKHAEKRVEQMIEKHEAKKPFVEKQPKPVLLTGKLPDKRAVLASGLVKSFNGRKVISGASFEIRTGEKVALVGPNGCGKTVLLRMLVGELEPDKGEAVLGAGTCVGYFPQDIASLDLEATALEEVLKSGAGQETARTVLGSLLLPKGFAERKLGGLSAGERSKVLLARILAGGANLLVLDEPTNHLDIDTLRALEALLVSMPCAILFASHDRAMLGRLAERVLEFHNGSLLDHHARYETLQTRQIHSAVKG